MSDAFPQIVDPWEIAEALAGAIDAWVPEWLAAYARQRDQDRRTYAELGKPIVRPGAVVLTDDPDPGCILYLEGETEPTGVDPDTNAVLANQGFGLIIFGGAHDLDTTGALIGAYTAVVRQLLLGQPGIPGYGGKLTYGGTEWTVFDPERAETLIGTTINIAAHNIQIGTAVGPPPGSTPRTDPTPEWPGAPTVETTHLDINPYDPDPEG